MFVRITPSEQIDFPSGVGGYHGTIESIEHVRVATVSETAPDRYDA